MNGAVDGIGFPHVSVDDGTSTEQAFGHLLALGHRRLGLLIGPPDHVPSRRKLAAFEALARRADLLADDTVERTCSPWSRGHAAATRLVRAGITGIICGSDVLALGAIRAVRGSTSPPARRGRRRPASATA